MKRPLNARQYRWLAGGVGLAYGIALFISDFPFLMGTGTGAALKNAMIYGPFHSVACVPGPGILDACTNGFKSAPMFSISVRSITVVAAVLIFWLLYRGSRAADRDKVNGDTHSLLLNNKSNIDKE